MGTLRKIPQQRLLTATLGVYDKKKWPWNRQGALDVDLGRPSATMLQFFAKRNCANLILQKLKCFYRVQDF